MIGRKNKQKTFVETENAHFTMGGVMDVNSGVMLRNVLLDSFTSITANVKCLCSWGVETTALSK
jgi:hypothetical protein